MPDTDQIERAKALARERFPDATIRTRSVRGRPLVLAIEDNLIRVMQLTGLPHDQAKHSV